MVASYTLSPPYPWDSARVVVAMGRATDGADCALHNLHSVIALLIEKSLIPRPMKPGILRFAQRAMGRRLIDFFVRIKTRT